jgi:uncharacterized protein (TIGR01777 family)
MGQLYKMPAIPMNILMTGASGFIGRAVVEALKEHSVRPLSGRRLMEGPLDLETLKGVDAVLHLAGENVACGRWTSSRKAAIRDSRVMSAGKLAESCRTVGVRIFVCASAVGYYGNRGDEWVDETSAAGEGFLADVCRNWEEACGPAVSGGARVVHLRFGVVIGRGGGAIAKMLTPFKMGLGGPVGSGSQYMSWISLEDAAAAAKLALESDSLSGPVNVTAPEPVTNAAFAEALGRAVGKRAAFRMPAFAARLAFGEMADEMLLSGQRVRPAKLLAASFPYRVTALDAALQASL